MDIYLVDGTYELFRHHFAVPSHVTKEGQEVAATRGVLGSILGMIEGGVTHLGVATDHVIESFRNEMWPGYKTGAGVDPALLQQFPLVEDSLRAMGVVVWPMVELEADDALASAARLAGACDEVQRVYICSPDKDLGQCVVGERIVQMDRRKRLVLDEAAVIGKFGVAPRSIPDYLALVGDSADGFPGLPGFGPKASAALLSQWKHLEGFPDDPRQWAAAWRGGDRLCAVFQELREAASLFRDLATLRSDERLFDDVASLRWNGPKAEFESVAEALEQPVLWKRAVRISQRSQSPA